MTISLFMDGIVAVLLVATIGFCFVLNRRFTSFKRTSAELAAIISGFDTAIEKARDGVNSLKEAATSTGSELQESIDTARALRDEIAFLADSTTGFAQDRSNVSGPEHSQRRVGCTPDESADSTIVEAFDEVPGSEAENELKQALRQVR